MRLNGVQVTLDKPVSVLEFLKARGYDPARVAVECNGEMIPRAQFTSVLLGGSEFIEVVAFVGGG